MSEDLEFSLQDLGRLAAHLDALGAVIDWVKDHARDRDHGLEPAAAVLEGYMEEG